MDKIVNKEKGSGLDEVTLRALGVMSRMRTEVTIGQQTNLTTGEAARILFDPDGTIGSTQSVVDGIDYLASRINGTREMSRWWASNIRRLDALRELEDTEGGFVYEGKDGIIGMDDHGARVSAAAALSVLRFSDSETPDDDDIPVIIDGFTPDQPLEDLANRITTRLRIFGSGSSQVLFRVDDLPVLANTELTIIARYPTEKSPVNHSGDRQLD